MSPDDPVIITCSISGSLANREQCPAIPYTPEEYAAEARRIVDEGAAMIHIHARRPDGTPSYEIEDFQAIADANGGTRAAGTPGYRASRDYVAGKLLKAGYKANVIPSTAEAVVDCRWLPGREEAFLREVDELLGADVTREWVTHLPAVETPFEGDLVDAMAAALRVHDPEAHIAPYMLSGGTDAKSFATVLGLRCYGFAPLRLPADLDFASLFHGMTRVYQELLTVGRDANEMYLMKVPSALVGKTFVEAAGMFLRHREGKRSCLLIGVQAGETMMLNPVGGEAGPLKEGDEMILLSQVLLDPAQPLPTEPPLPAAPAGETKP